SASRFCIFVAVNLPRNCKNNRIYCNERYFGQCCDCPHQRFYIVPGIKCSCFPFDNCVAREENAISITTRSAESRHYCIVHTVFAAPRKDVSQWCGLTIWPCRSRGVGSHEIGDDSRFAGGLGACQYMKLAAG